MDRNHPSSLERGLPPEHQPTDELLACREGRTPRDRRSAHGLGREHRTLGERTARTFYRAKGWVTHVLGNIWQFTAPGEHPSWGATNTSAAWLCEHLYNHYRYSQDRAYLERIYPVMQGAARFFLTTLVKDPKSGYLVNVPTTSPENSYYTPQGKAVAVAAGSTIGQSDPARALLHVRARQRWASVVTAPSSTASPRHCASSSHYPRP